jgi:hypothetical protein
VAALAKAYGPGLSAEAAPTLEILDPRLLGGGPGIMRSTLVWQVIVSRTSGQQVSKAVFVDAGRGKVLLEIDRLQAALSRTVCDANGTATQVPCSRPVRTEGSAPKGKSDVDKAYDYAGDTWRFFSALGRDSVDGNGLALKSTVRWCQPQTATSPAQCPLQNAFWNGKQMVYGAGWASADDVVAHELTHGVTQYTSNLYYYFQSGSINEAISDVFGEFVDLTNGRGNDSPSVRWLVGEDSPDGALRSLKDPPAYDQPDRTGSSLYEKDITGADSGGVHTNSGVANKAAFLMTDGGTFNGQTVTGIGIAKASRVWYQTELLLSSGSNFRDLGTTLSQACRSIEGTEGITESDCQQVDAAVLATEMAKAPINALTPDAPVCDAGTAQTIFSDGFDSGPSDLWTKAATIGTPNWYWGSQQRDYGHYAKDGADNLWGDDPEARSDNSIAMASSVTLPTGAHLRFDHAYGFEQTKGMNADGGLVEYSTDRGATWKDAKSLFSENGYDGTLTTQSDNPLGGRSAFVNKSMGYMASRLDLSSLAGQSVRFRFRIVSDTGTGDAGWSVDNFRIYTCADGPPAPTIISSPPALTNSKVATVAFTQGQPGGSAECALDGGLFAGCSSPASFTGLSDGPHSLRVRQVGSDGKDGPWASVDWKVDTVGPPVKILSRTGPAATPRLTFRSTAKDVVLFECAFDSEAWTACTSPLTRGTPLTKRLHTFRVRARDLAGNSSPAPASTLFRVK